jgi:adenine-specific DNA-methyltransferase
MNSFFSYIRRNRDKLTRRHGDALAFCAGLSKSSSELDFPLDVRRFLDTADADDRDYAIASAYALLIGDDRRRELSAYFTPPALARAALEASTSFLDKMENPAVLDPACGGGSFLTPVARHLIKRKCRQGISAKKACESTLAQLRGIEIDRDLAALSQQLLRKMLRNEFDFVPKGALGVVRCANALSATVRKKYDLVIGNPPYGKISDKSGHFALEKAGLANLGGHTNIYSLFLLRSLDWLKPGGGLVFVLPTSFVAGPYFAGLRQEVLNRARVLRIDLHEQREALFLGAIQDVCLLTLQKNEAVGSHQAENSYELGVIDADGARSTRGKGRIGLDGEPWTLPVATKISFLSRSASNCPAEKAFAFSDYGYRVRVGKVVPTRERRRLHQRRKAGDIPLVWASVIRPNGKFDFDAAATWQ